MIYLDNSDWDYPPSCTSLGFILQLSVKFHQYQFLLLGMLSLTRNVARRPDMVIPIYPQTV